MSAGKILIKYRPMLAQVAPTNLTGFDAQLVYLLNGSTGYEAWRSMDGNDTTFFRSSSFYDQIWVGWDFLSPIAIRKYRWLFKTLGTGNASAWNFQSSDDNSNWTDREAVNPGSVAPNAWYESTVQNWGSHRYWRLWLKATDTGGGDMANAGIGTLWMYAYQ